MSESFSALLDKSLETLDMKQGSIVSGVVLDIDKDWVTVHVGLKSEGIISLDEFRDNEGKVDINVGDDVEVGAIKRFNLSYGGYAIVRLTKIKEKGLADVDDVRLEVTEILKNKKKATMIIKENSGNTSLEDLAASNGLEVVSALAVNQKSATLVGAGNEPYVVGAGFALDVDATSGLIIGNNGVYMLQVTSRNIVEDLEDYSLYANNLSQQEREKVAGLVIQALESSATIEDNRSLYY